MDAEEPEERIRSKDVEDAEAQDDDKCRVSEVEGCIKLSGEALAAAVLAVAAVGGVIRVDEVAAGRGCPAACIRIAALALRWVEAVGVCIFAHDWNIM